MRSILAKSVIETYLGFVIWERLDVGINVVRRGSLDKLNRRYSLFVFYQRLAYSMHSIHHSPVSGKNDRMLEICLPN